MKRIANALAVACLCATLLQGCGGGGGGGDTPAASIAMQPQSVTTDDGTQAQFFVRATNAIAYRWQQSLDGGATWSDVPDGNQPQLSVPAVYAATPAQYRCIVSGRGGDVTSAVVTLAAKPVAVQFLQQPYDQAPTSGQPFTLGILATGTAFSVRWQLSTDGSTWADIPGATGTSLQVDRATMQMNGYRYRAVATNVLGDTASQPATLTVFPNADTPRFIVQPSSATVSAGATARFDARTVTLASDEAIQWQSSVDGGTTWAELPGPQFATLVLPAVSAADDGKQFRRLATKGYDTATSTAATLHVGTTGRHLDLLAGQIGGYGEVDDVGTNARFDGASWPAIDSHGNVYVGSFSALRRIDPAGRVSTVAGSSFGQVGGDAVFEGIGGAVDLGIVTGVAVGPGDVIYIVDSTFDTIRKVSPDGSVSLLAGSPGHAGSADGTGTAARFNAPQGIAIDADGSLILADTGNDTIRRITPAGAVTTIAGKAGIAGSGGITIDDALFNHPTGVAVDATGLIYVTDTDNYTVRKISKQGFVSEWAGQAGSPGSTDGSAGNARFGYSTGIVVDAQGNAYVGDGGNFAIRKIAWNGDVTTLVKDPVTFEWPGGLALDAAGNLVLADSSSVRLVTAAGAIGTWSAGARNQTGTADGTGSAARFESNFGGDIAVDAAGNLFVLDNAAVRKVTPAGVVTTVFATGWNHAARGIAFDAQGNFLVADAQDCVVRRVTPAGVATLVAGQVGICAATDGASGQASLQGPSGVAIDATGVLYVADYAGIRRVTPDGAITTWVRNSSGIFGGVDGPLATALLGAWPADLVFDGAGNLFVTQWGAVRKITPDGTVSTLAGSLVDYGHADGQGAAARFGTLQSIALDASGNAYVAEGQYGTIRKITPSGVVTTVLGTTNVRGVILGADPALNDVSGVAVIDAHHLAVTSEHAVLVYTMP
jgi:sugar lactone lactonase YvrE